MAIWSARQIWKTLPRPKREEVALSLWQDERLDRGERLASMMPWLAGRGLRMEYVAKLPKSRRASLLAQGGLPEDTASQVLMSYHLVHQRPMLGRFLDLLGVSHQDGLVDDGELEEPPQQKVVDTALAKLKDEFDADAVTLYARTLTALDPVTWAAVGEHAGDTE